MYACTHTHTRAQKHTETHTHASTSLLFIHVCHTYDTNRTSVFYILVIAMRAHIRCGEGWCDFLKHRGFTGEAFTHTPTHTHTHTHTDTHTHSPAQPR